MNLIKYYSQFSKAHVADHDNTFLDTGAITPTTTLSGQNDINERSKLSSILDKYLYSSLTISAKNQVNIHISSWCKNLNNEYYIDGEILYGDIDHFRQPNNDRLAEEIFEKLKISTSRNPNSQQNQCWYI